MNFWLHLLSDIEKPPAIFLRNRLLPHSTPSPLPQHADPLRRITILVTGCSRAPLRCGPLRGRPSARSRPLAQVANRERHARPSEYLSPVMPFAKWFADGSVLVLLGSVPKSIRRGDQSGKGLVSGGRFAANVLSPPYPPVGESLSLFPFPLSSERGQRRVALGRETVIYRQNLRAYTLLTAICYTRITAHTHTATRLQSHRLTMVHDGSMLTLRQHPVTMVHAY
jgi:hypothetical protein